VAAAVVRGGLDLVKDDETALDKVEAETGKKAFYAVNVTAVGR